MPPMLLPDGVSIRSMTPADVAAGLALCRASHWNQTEQDWRFFLTEAPHGALVAEAGGRVIGTVATLPYGPFTWISMVLVDPVARGKHVGTTLLRRGLELVGADATARLDATPAGEVIYRTIGFASEYRLARWFLDATPPIARRIRRATARTRGLAGDSRAGPASVRRLAPWPAPTSRRRIAGVRTGDPTRERRAGVCVRASRSQPGPPRPAGRRQSGHRGGAARLDPGGTTGRAASTWTCPTISRSGATSSRGSVSRSSGRFCGCTGARSRRPGSQPPSMRSPGRSSAEDWGLHQRQR